MSTSIEQVAIARIITDGDIVPFINGGIKTEFFVSERGTKAWTFIYDYWMSYSEVPTLTAFGRQFPGWDLPDNDEPVTAIVAEMIRDRRQLLLEDGFSRAGDLVQQEETDGAVDAVREMLAAMDIETSETTVVLDHDIIGGLIIDAKTRDANTLIGIPTGFPTIDQATGGLQPEQLITITALPKHGKTTIEMKMAEAAQEAGELALVVTFEMSTKEVLQRKISFGAEVPFMVLTRGRIPTPAEIERMEAYEQHVLDDLPPMIIVHDVGAALTVGGIGALIKLHQPTVVFIDGTYMMDDEHGEPQGSPRALTNITRALKRLAQAARIPIVQTTQSLIAKTSKRGGVGLGSIGYSSSFIQDSDAIIGLDREDLALPTATLKIIAARASRGVEVALRFDYEAGIVEESGGFVTSGSVRAGAGGLIDDGD